MKIEAPDVVVATVSMVLGVQCAIIAARSSWALAVVAGTLLLAAATARVHLRVRPGSALLVRTLFGVPWWIARRDERYAAPENVWLWDTWEGDELVLPARPNGRSPSVVVLELGLARASDELGWSLDREIRRVLAGERWTPPRFTPGRAVRDDTCPYAARAFLG